MLIYVIKNNIKLMFRNKWLMVWMIVGPIIIIAALASAFNDMMKAYEVPDSFHIGYSLSENSEFAGYMESLKQYGKEAGFVFTEFQEGDANEILLRNDCRSFVEFKETSYTIYQLDQYKMEGMATEYFMDVYLKNAYFHNMQESADHLMIKEIQLDFLPTVEAKDYYGIIEIVYFLWMSFIAFACVVSDEKKYGIRKKYDVSPVSDLKLYFSNVTACMFVTVFEMGIAIAVVTKIFDIRWGNLPFTILLLFLTAIGAIAFGLFLTYLFDNLAVTVIAAFTIIWIAGFFGGSFETYMFSAWSESVKILSPIYHINRALVEFSSIGSSKYMSSAVLYLFLISVFSVIGGTLSKIRRGKA